MSSYFIEKAGTEQRENFVELVEESFSKEAAQLRDTIWEWGLTENPSGKLAEPHILLLKKEDETLGSSYEMPFRLQLSSGVIGGYWSCGTNTRKKASGRGMILIKHIMADDTVRIGFPYKHILPILIRYGGKIVGETEQVFFLANAGNWLKVKKNSISWLSGIASLGWNGLMIFYRRGHKDKSLQIEELSSFDERFDEFWEKTAPDYDGIMVRDRAFLNWRFFQCPVKQYSVYALTGNGVLQGYVVTDIAEKGGLKFGSITDLFVARGDLKSFDTLLAFAKQHLLEQQVDVIAMMKIVAAQWINNSLKKHGFLFRKPHLKMVVGAKHENMMAASYKSDKAWITFAESDNDISI